MFSYIKGTLEELTADSVILECGQIGYRIRIPSFTFDSLPPRKAEVMLYTHLQVKEDGLALFGFLSKDDLFLFQLLLGVSGVGPKGALGILSALTADDLRIAITTQDAKAIAKAQGIGLKTAQRIIIDLKDKLKLEDVLMKEASDVDVVGNLSDSNVNQIAREAIEALMALGYSSNEAAAAVRQVSMTDCKNVETCLKAALRKMAI